MISYFLTDIGKKRQVNQDYVFCQNDPVGRLPNLFIVADGMGGHNAGDFASRFCVETIVELVKKSVHKTPVCIIENAIKETNNLLIAEAAGEAGLKGMGTTLVMASVIDGILYIANVGDSRLYLLSEGSMMQITEDHSLVEAMIRNGEIERTDARFHPNKNVITRALGAALEVAPDFFELQLKNEDIILMCSDGLSNMIEDKEIEGILCRHSDSLEEAAKCLIEKANAYGGKDNIAIVLVKP